MLAKMYIWLLLEMFLLFRGIKCLKNPEVELLNHLISNYNSDALPRVSVDKPVALKFGMAVRQLLDMNEKEQVMTTSVWIRHYWNDQFLKWNSTEWDNVTFVSVSPDKIWKPDISLYNNAASDFQGFEAYGKTKINVYPNGDCVWLIPAILQSACKMKMDYFPFDTQICPLTFGSWVYDGAALDFQKKIDEVDMGSFSKSGAFKVSGGGVDRTVEKFTCCPNPYIKLIFKVVLERRIQFYLFNLLIPGIIIAMLSCFTFLLPAGSGERTGLVITNLLAMSVYVLMVSDEIPPSPDAVPLLVQFFTCMVAEIAIALVINCILIPIAIWDTPMPRFLKRIFFGYFGPMMFVGPPCRLGKDCSEEEEESLLSKTNASNQAYEMVNQNGKAGDIDHKEKHAVSGNSHFERIIASKLEIIAKKMEDEKEASTNNADWELLIRIADRMFFVLFAFIIIVSCLSLIVPNL